MIEGGKESNLLPAFLPDRVGLRSSLCFPYCRVVHRELEEDPVSASA